MYFGMKNYLKNTCNHTAKHAHAAMEREVANKLNKKNKEMFPLHLEAIDMTRGQVQVIKVLKVACNSVQECHAIFEASAWQSLFRLSVMNPIAACSWN
jgi:flavoprotein